MENGDLGLHSRAIFWEYEWPLFIYDIHESKYKESRKAFRPSVIIPLIPLKAQLRPKQ